MDLVIAVVFEVTVVLVTGETVEACIFRNNLPRTKSITSATD